MLPLSPEEALIYHRLFQPLRNGVGINQEGNHHQPYSCLEETERASQESQEKSFKDNGLKELSRQEKDKMQGDAYPRQGDEEAQCSISTALECSRR